MYPAVHWQPCPPGGRRAAAAPFFFGLHRGIASALHRLGSHFYLPPLDMGGFKRKKVRAVDPNCQDRKKVEAYKAKFSPKNFNLAPKAGLRTDDTHPLLKHDLCSSVICSCTLFIPQMIPTSRILFLTTRKWRAK